MAPHSSAIGQSLPRLDGPRKVAGLTRYAADLRLPGMLHARLVLSPHAHARIVRINSQAALALPGVVAVLGGKDLPLANPDPSSRNRAPLALDRALFNGHPVAAVLAESEAIAQDAAALVEVVYEELPAAMDLLEAMRPDAPRVREAGGDGNKLSMHGAESGGGGDEGEDQPPNVVSTEHLTRGDVAQGFREAEVIVERTYRTSWVHQGYLEPQVAIASVDPLGCVTVWASTQALFYARSEVAEALGLPEHQVRVVAMPLGGAFGGKFVLFEPLAVALAVAVRRPVSLVLSRTEDLLATNPAPQSRFEVKIGAGRDGRLTALQARVIFDAGAFEGAPVGAACSLLGSYYRFPHLDIRGYEVLTNRPGSGAYRAPGAPQATFAIESAVDEVARELGLDPLELRLRNAARPGDSQANGRPWPKMGMTECLEALKSHISSRASRVESSHSPPARSAHPEPFGRLRTGPVEGPVPVPGPVPVEGHLPLRRGIGIALGGWSGGVEPANAICRLNGDGSLSVIVGSVDMSGTNTGFAQIAAEAFGLPPHKVQVMNADSDSAPYAGASGGSKITYTVGTAVQRAAEDARRQLLAIAADHLEAPMDDLELVDGRVQVRGAPEHSAPIGGLAKLAMQFGGSYEPVFGRGASATVARAPGFAAHLAEVEVDVETGHVRVVRWLAVQDVGRAINPAAIEGQIRGAVAQGIGWALLERLVYDSDGRLLSATLMDYALPAIDRVPPVEAVLVEVPADQGPFGAKQVGEPPVIAAAAAIANALADATGHRFTDLPVTSQAIVEALWGAGRITERRLPTRS